MSYIAASLTLDDGRIVRFGGDEADPENVPYNISWDTTIPGGFGVGSITVPRPENLTADDAKLFADVTIYGPGRKVLYEGYVTGVPQVGADEIELQLSGWSTALDRIQTFKQIFVDRDLNSWGSATTARKAGLRAFNYTGLEPGGVEWDNSTSLPGLVHVLSANTANPVSESWYDAGSGLTIASIYYDMVSLSGSTDTGLLGVSSDDVATTTTLTADLLTGTNSTAAGTFTATTPRRYALIQLLFTGAAVGTDKTMTIRRLAVFGNHGLTKRGTAPDEGYYGSDIIDYIVRQSPLNATLGDSIEETTFVIPHLVFRDDTTLTDAIEQVTALGGSQNVRNDWGVYDDRTFFWRSPGTYGRTWHVRRDEVATSSSEGPDADRRVAGVKVLYEDAAGTTLSVGPPGSNSDYETTDLLDSDTTNPAYRIPGAYAVESVGLTSQQGAINIGTMILNERNRLQWRGSVELQGEVTDSNGNTYPVSEVRAGDQVVISDDPDTSPRPINETSYDHAGQSLTASVGARPDSLEALLTQLATVTERI